MLKLIRNMRKKEVLMALAAVVLILGQIYFDLTLPDFMSRLTMLVQTAGSDASEIWLVGAKMLGCAVASMGLAVICGYLMSSVAAGFSYTLRDRIFGTVADLGEQEMNRFSVPSLIVRTTNDVTQIQMLIAMGLQILVKAPVMAVWAVMKIIGKSWQLSLFTGAIVVFLLVMMLSILFLLLPRFKRVQRMMDEINSLARENISGIRVVHAYNAEEYQNEKFDRANTDLYRTQLFNQRTFSVMMPSLTLAMNVLSLGIYWLGARLIGNIPAAEAMSRMTLFSDIVVFSTYATYVIMSLMMIVLSLIHI